MGRWLGICLVVLAAATGCNQATNKAPAKDECERYAKAFCEKVGEKLPDCKAIREVENLLPPAACQAGNADLVYTANKVKEERKPCDELQTRLCKDIGEKTESCKMVNDQTPQMAPDRCKTMLEKYADVLAGLQRQEQMNAPVSEELQKNMVAGAQATFGDAASKAQIVEFSDFQCPFCARAAKATKDLKTKYGERIHVVFRQFPLAMHPDAHLAAQASLAAAAQGKFWEFHDMLFEHQKELKRPDLSKHAKAVGLDVAKFDKELDSGMYKAAVDADLALGKTVSVTATPTVFLNGKRMAKSSNVEALSEAIDGALGK